MDSNFISAEDLPKLSSPRVLIHAMCSSNRPSWLWKDGLQKDLPRSYTRVAQGKDLVAGATFNNGRCNLASNCFVVVPDEENFTVEERRTLLKMYDKTKGFSDLFGQLTKTYWPGERFQNWKLSLLLGWVKYAVTNSYIIHKLREDNITHRDFVFQIGTNLLAAVDK